VKVLEAEVGIGRLKRRNHVKNAIFCWLIKPDLTPLDNAFYCSVADSFAECDMRSLEQSFVMDTS